MNTELIYYRAWNEKNNVMLSPDYLMENNIGLSADGTFFKCFDSEIQHFLKPLFYSQLNDKNDVPVFEGSIVKAETHIPKYYQIEFIEGGFCATHPNVEGYPLDINHFYPSIGCQFEVVGTIQQNPELLESKDGQ